ncbi:MAG: D-aminoacyl-tRNA deacylase [Candidatus Edwardsbacteria bacterium]|nr:D-aminoacyl-tRNA deacylase [Candidatus Edwardsbacteria bacterium]
MIAVIQRVAKCAVRVDEREYSSIGKGLLVLLGVSPSDVENDVESLADKIVNLRIFDDEEGKMNRSLLEAGGQMMVVSQFTLCADCRRGRRPSFTNAAAPELGERLYNRFADVVRTKDIEIATGKFGAKMLVEIANDGPVTIALDTKFSHK